jgi:hypothetical protein
VFSHTKSLKKGRLKSEGKQSIKRRVYNVVLRHCTVSSGRVMPCYISATGRNILNNVGLYNNRNCKLRLIN